MYRRDIPLIYMYITPSPTPPFACVLQAMCFLAGANSIFDGDKLLTTPNNERSEDEALFEQLGLKSRPAFLPYASGNATSSGFEGAIAEGSANRVAAHA